MVAKPLMAIADGIVRSTADLPEDYLAYLALTSKPELQIRDLLSWTLHQQFTPNFVVAREWTPPQPIGGGRTDLAILTPEGRPTVLLEAKSFMTFDAVRKNHLERYLGYLERDRDKARRISSDAAVLLLLVSIHAADMVPSNMNRVIKYRSGINQSLQNRTAEDLADEAQHATQAGLTRFGQVLPVDIGRGEAFGVRCVLSGYVVECA